MSATLLCYTTKFNLILKLNISLMSVKYLQAAVWPSKSAFALKKLQSVQTARCLKPCKKKYFEYLL